MKKFLRRYWQDLLFILLIGLTYPLFFYKLGQSSLVSWDEAWYAEIAKNILLTGNLFELFFNGSQYFDHPPAGFWLIAFSFKVFGISDFSARLAPAVCGFLSLFTVYFLGRELFSRSAGFFSAIGLASSQWFLFRSRSGNLDTILTLFFLLTLLLALRAARDKKYLIPFAASFTLLFLTKSVVPFVILPALVVIFWKSKSFVGREFRYSLALFLTFFGLWILISYLDNPGFFSHYTKIGLPGVEAKTPIFDNLRLTKEYLHNGIGNWFWPGVFLIFLSLFLRKKSYLILAIFFVTFFAPFIFSQRGHIWHLIPLHPVLILALFGFLYDMVGISFNIAHFLTLQKKVKFKFFLNKHAKDIFRFTSLLAVLIYLGGGQINKMWNQFIDIPAFISDEAILSHEAAKYPGKFYIDEDYVPAAAFYSGRHVEKIWSDGISDLFEKEKEFVFITKDWRLQQADISEDQYEIIKKDRDKILIKKIKKAVR